MAPKTGSKERGYHFFGSHQVSADTKQKAHKTHPNTRGVWEGAFLHA
jgi:hypothetical protein